MNIIRKIIIGQNPKDGMAYYVGMNAGGGTVSAITNDDRALALYGINRYLIYIHIDGEGTMLWKAVDNMPSIVEYDCRFD